MTIGLFLEGSTIELGNVRQVLITTNLPLSCAMISVPVINTLIALTCSACLATTLVKLVLLAIISLLAHHVHQPTTVLYQVTIVVCVS